MFLRSLEVLRKKEADPDKYPFLIPAIKTLDSITFRKNVTFFVGENGSGKSTLLEAIAYQCGFNAAGGGRNNAYDVEASYSALGDAIRLSWLPKKKDAQFIIATHSPILLGYPDAHILNFDAKPISEIRYEDTLHYIVTRRFLENRKSVLDELFGD